MILSKFNIKGWMAISVLLACSGAALAQNETVLVKRPAQLREAPGDSARSLASLPVQTAVTRLGNSQGGQGERQGAWIKVRMADGTLGWLHMFDITAANASMQGGTGGASGVGVGALRSLSSFFNKGSTQAPGNTLATSTVGIRGLGAEDLANAQPNLAALAQTGAMRVDAAQARQFAGTASLVSRPVEPLPAPASPVAAPSQSGPFNTDLSR